MRSGSDKQRVDMSSTTTTSTIQNIKENARPSISTHRLLYRGSLALPDSEMILDGLAFVMEIAFKSPMSLINSPIPLGLESMRGRPLRLVAVINISDITLECFGDVSMYIHPDAFLTRSFFERTLCSDTPLISDANNMRTRMAVRIGLGDGQGPDDSDILVFGQLDTSTLPNESPPTLQLLAGRIAPPPVPSSPPRRIPRPDDPLPRANPLVNLHLSPGRRGLKRKRSSGTNPFTTDHATAIALAGSKAQKGDGMAASALLAALAEAQAEEEKKRKSGKVVVGDGEPISKGLTRRPLLRVTSSKGPGADKSKGQRLDTDGFVVPGLPARTSSLKGKDVDPGQANGTESELETKNKNAIKKRTLAALEACGISKSHSQFKDMYGSINSGVKFAVRNIIRDTHVDRDLIVKLVETHLEMYFGGRGGKYNLHEKDAPSQTEEATATNAGPNTTADYTTAPPPAA